METPELLHYTPAPKSPQHREVDKLQRVVRDLEYELQKQRAVTMRFLISDDFLIPGGRDPRPYYLAAELRYRAEYDVAQAFIALVSRGT